MNKILIYMLLSVCCKMQAAASSSDAEFFPMKDDQSEHIFSENAPVAMQDVQSEQSGQSQPEKIQIIIGEHIYPVAKKALANFGVIQDLMQAYPGQELDLSYFTQEDRVTSDEFEQLTSSADQLSSMQNQDSSIRTLKLAKEIKTTDPKKIAQLLKTADFLLMKEPIIDAIALKIAQLFYEENELYRFVGKRDEILKRLAVEIARSGADAHQVKQLIDNAGKPAQDLFPHLAKPWWLAHNKQLPKFLKDIPFGVSVQDLIDHGLVPNTVYEPLLNLRMLNLSHLRLNSLDGLQKIEGIKDVQMLRLRNNQLKRIEPGAFAGLDNLKQLSLAGNQLTHVNPGAFKGLDYLKELDLEGNQLTHIKPRAFVGLANLEKLYLDYNQLKRIEPRAFAGLDKLDWLQLGNNQLEGIGPGTFAGLDRLEGLWLHRNQLKHLEPKTFAGLDKLDWLQLGNNQLEGIGPGTLAGLDKLECLWLNNNQLECIEPGAFIGLNKLEYLWLNNNQLEHIEPRAFAGLVNLEKLWLHRNQLELIKPEVLAGLDRLIMLGLNNNKLSLENIAAIKEVLPRAVEVIADHQHAQSAAASSE